MIRSFVPQVDKWGGIMYIYAMFHWLAMSHTCYNPVILCWMNTKFRSGFCSVAYKARCLRSLIDSWYFNQDTRRNTVTTGMSQGQVSCRSKLITVAYRDETIVFKSRDANNITSGVAHYNNPKFHQMLEETSSENPL